MSTTGRPKRKRAKSSGSAVRVGAHSRTPRGPDRGKKRVRVDGYRRGKPKRAPKKR